MSSEVGPAKDLAPNWSMTSHDLNSLLRHGGNSSIAILASLNPSHAGFSLLWFFQTEETKWRNKKSFKKCSSLLSRSKSDGVLPEEDEGSKQEKIEQRDQYLWKVVARLLKLFSWQKCPYCSKSDIFRRHLFSCCVATFWNLLMVQCYPEVLFQNVR